MPAPLGVVHMDEHHDPGPPGVDDANVYDLRVVVRSGKQPRSRRRLCPDRGAASGRWLLARGPAGVPDPALARWREVARRYPENIGVVGVGCGNFVMWPGCPAAKLKFPRP